MRRLTVPALAIALLLLSALGCKSRKQPPSAAPVTATDVSPASTLAVADPRYAHQLLRGFYEVEASWRWTQKSFAVRLATPAGSAQRGAQLQLRFGIPDPVIQNLKSVTLTAVVNGFNLASQRYEKSGQFSYVRDVPANQLQADSVPVEFALDHALPPGPVDRRELGIVVTEVGLTTKLSEQP